LAAGHPKAGSERHRDAGILRGWGVLAESLRQTQQLVLNDKWWRLQERLDELEQEFEANPAKRILRDQIRRLKRDQADMQKQIDALGRR